MTTRKLIVNADDFGFTVGVSCGIVRAFRDGIVTSCSIMASGDAFRDAVELAQANPALAVGCHLTLLGTKPIAEKSRIESLLDSSGALPRSVTEVVRRLISGRARQEHIELEFRSQIETVKAAGIKPTHLDTHKHLHALPRIFEALAKVAREFGISRVRNPLEQVRLNSPRGTGARRRWKEFKKQQAVALALRMTLPSVRARIKRSGLRAPDFCYGISLTGMLDASAIREIVKRLEAGVTELVCHPGLYDDQLERAGTRLKREREGELEALTDPGVRRTLEEHQIQMISYRDI